MRIDPRWARQTVSKLRRVARGSRSIKANVLRMYTDSVRTYRNRTENSLSLSLSVSRSTIQRGGVSNNPSGGEALSDRANAPLWGPGISVMYE